MSKSTPQAPAAEPQAPVAAPVDPLAQAKAEAEAAGAALVVEMPTLIKGASVALRIDH